MTNQNISVDIDETEEEKSITLETKGELTSNGTLPCTMGHKTQVTPCCAWVENSVKNWGLFRWYIAPITYDIGFSISCLLYHFVNFAYALGIWIFLVTCICTFVPLIILACVGIPLLYLTSEITILLTRLCFYMNIYLVEKNNLLFTSQKWKVKLTLDNKNLPLCETICQSGNRLNRLKFIATSINFYIVLAYHLVFNPICALTLGMTVWLVLYPMYYMSGLIRYPIYPQYFRNNRECVGGADCSKSRPCKCHGLAIDSYGMVVVIALLSLLVIPFACHLCNYAADLSKKCCYYFLTDFYKNKGDDNPNKSLLNTNKTNNNTSNTNLVKDNTIELNENDTVPRTDKDLNDGGIKEKNMYDDL